MVSVHVPSHRIVEHLQLWSSRSLLTQNRLQEAFYAIYEPEIATSLDLFCEFKKDDPNYVKRVRKFSSTYLLDKLELNTKSRCVFCWSGVDGC